MCTDMISATWRDKIRGLQKILFYTFENIKIIVLLC